MTFWGLAKSLPNGFHDAELHRFEMDWVRRTLLLDLFLWMDQTEDAVIFRPARVVVEDVAYLVIEMPDTGAQGRPGPIQIDAGEGQPSQVKSVLPKPPPDTTAIWIWLDNVHGFLLSGFLLFAAGNASLEWTGPEEKRS